MKHRARAGGVALLLVCALFSGCPRKKAPDADFSADKTTGPAPLAVQFTDLTAPGSSPVTEWRWLFGDGAESAEQNPAHTYGAEGVYTVSLEATSAAGANKETKTGYITVTEPEPEPGQVETVMLPGDVPLLMVWVPAGIFQMGAVSGEQGAQSDESPRHEVTLTKGFWIGKYEVTKAQWAAVMDGAVPWEGRGNISDDPDSPAVWLTWEDCAAFTARLSVLTGKAYRLPAEAEWERAGRAETNSRFYWGDDLDRLFIGENAWWIENTWSAGERYAHTVGLKIPNTFGLHDMAGNVWEWCQNWYYPYTGDPVTDPRGPAAGDSRVMRGGGWFNNETECRPANRTYKIPQYANYGTGFRVAR